MLELFSSIPQLHQRLILCLSTSLVIQLHDTNSASSWQSPRWSLRDTQSLQGRKTMSHTPGQWLVWLDLNIALRGVAAILMLSTLGMSCSPGELKGLGCAEYSTVLYIPTNTNRSLVYPWVSYGSLVSDAYTRPRIHPLEGN